SLNSSFIVWAAFACSVLELAISSVLADTWEAEADRFSAARRIFPTVSLSCITILFMDWASRPTSSFVWMVVVSVRSPAATFSARFAISLSGWAIILVSIFPREIQMANVNMMMAIMIFMVVE